AQSWAQGVVEVRSRGADGTRYRPAFMVSSPVKVLYLPSAGRSGSTLLDRLLGQLGGVFGAGELSWVWQKGLVENGKCGCGVPLRECPVWNEVFDRAFGGMDAVDGAAMMA